MKLKQASDDLAFFKQAYEGLQQRVLEMEHAQIGMEKTLMLLSRYTDFADFRRSLMDLHLQVSKLKNTKSKRRKS